MLNSNQIIFILIGTQVGTWISVRSLRKALREERARFMKLHGIATYLIHKLEEEDVDWNEFDLIALGLITERDNA